MFDTRRFTDSYDLYQPSVTTSASGSQTITQGAATLTNQPCLFYPRGTQPVSIGNIGPDADFDALLLVPHAASIQPGGKGEQPYHVTTGGKGYLVTRVWNASNRGLFKVVLLTERRT